MRDIYLETVPEEHKKKIVQNWMDMQAKAYKMLRRTLYFDDHAKTFNYMLGPGNIQMNQSAFKDFIDMFNFPITLRNMHCSTYPYELSFRYKGLIFLALYETLPDWYEEKEDEE